MEFPHIQKLVDKYGSKGFVVLSVNTMPNKDAEGKLMMNGRGYKFTHLTTPDDSWAEKNYPIKSYPTTFLLDAEGKVILQQSGYSPASIWAMDQAVSHLTEGVKVNKQR